MNLRLPLRTYSIVIVAYRASQRHSDGHIASLRIRHRTFYQGVKITPSRLPGGFGHCCPDTAFDL